MNHHALGVVPTGMAEPRGTSHILQDSKDGARSRRILGNHVLTIRDVVDARFRDFRDQASQFSREIVQTLHIVYEPPKSAELNLRVMKSVFGKWALEILVALYALKSAGFRDLQKTLRPISASVLSQKLKKLESGGLIARTLQNSRPPTARYSLTEKGLTVSKLGEPVILYLRFTEDLL